MNDDLFMKALKRIEELEKRLNLILLNEGCDELAGIMAGNYYLESQIEEIILGNYI